MYNMCLLCQFYRSEVMSLSEVIHVVNNMSAKENGMYYTCNDSCNDYIDGKYFCAEGTICSSKVSVTVEDVGKLNFPIDMETVNRLLNVSTGAECGTLTRSVNDSSVRNTQVIPEGKLKVEFDKQVFAEVLSKIASQLKIDENYKLVPHLYNMLVYKEGGFFKEHRETEKFDNMIATLVLVLPAFFKGGELSINHVGSCKSFDTSDLNFIKCIAFYSDCSHWISPVWQGCRVVLTYNIELKGPDSPLPIDVTIVDEPLNNAIAQYFNTDEQPKYLILCLTHLYSEDSLMWYKLKGNDRIIAWAMFAVSKKQKLTPYLALADSQEIWRESDYSEPDMTNKSIKLYHWLDENNMPCDRPEQFDVNAFYNEACSVKFWNHYTPYKENNIGFYGNGPAKREQWYCLSYIILLKE